MKSNLFWCSFLSPYFPKNIAFMARYISLSFSFYDINVNEVKIWQADRRLGSRAAAVKV